MHLAVSDAHEHRDVAVQIDQRVHLHRALAFAEASPGKHGQTQVDGGRVERIGAALQLRAEWIVDVQHARPRDQNLREVGEDTPIVIFIGVGQGRPGNATANAHVIELAGRGSQAGFNVSQTFAIGELCEGHAQELIPTRKAAQPLIAAVARHAPAELTIWKEGDQLREYRAAKVHPSW